MNIFRNMKIKLKLILFFLLVGTVPLITIGVISYHRTQDALVKNTKDKLTAVGQIKKHTLETFFGERFGDASVFSALPFIESAISRLDSCSKEAKSKGYSGRRLLEYQPFKEEFDRYYDFVKKYKEEYGYYDVFLLSPNSGRVLLTEALEDDFGSELQSEDHHLARAWQEMTESKKPVLTDVLPYEPSNNAPAIFLVAPSFKNGNYIGSIAFQISLEAIDKIMQEKSGLGESGETYLLGNKDYLFRSNSRFLEDSIVQANLLDTSRAGSTVLNIKNACSTAKDASAGKDDSCYVTPDYRGIPVFSAFTTVTLSHNLQWILLSEIDEEEAMSMAKSILKTILWGIGMAVFAIVIISLLVSLDITTSLKTLASQAVSVAKSVASGDINRVAEKESVPTEFQPILEGVNDIVRVFKAPVAEIMEVMTAVATDDLSGRMNGTYEGAFKELQHNVNYAIQSIEDSKEYTDALLKSIGAPMIVTNNELQVVSMNEACENATGYTAAEAVGKISCEAFTESSNSGSPQISVREAIASRALLLGETVAKGKNGERFPVLAVCSPIIDSKGEILGGVEILTDLSEQKETLSIVAGLIAAAKEGKLDQRADIGTATGDYKALREGINEMLEAIVNPIREASEVLNRAAAKELSVRVEGAYVGTFDELKQNINKALNNIDGALQQVMVASEQVAAASEQISSGAQSLSQGSSEQASSLEEISASMEEMGAQTKQNAANANEATKVASESNRYATNGSDAMEKMNDAMQRIKNSSNETAKIIKTIDEIATQTNLLALNAAVEAARAGEAGLGFAVVADEVRNLAQRSAEAAKDTANMIEESMANAQNGVDIAGDVATILSDIKDSSKKVRDFVEEISAASTEQSRGIQQINEAVTQMNHVTQTNAANAEESASSAEELSSQAAEMRTMVGAFTLSEGGDGNGSELFVPQLKVRATMDKGRNHSAMNQAMAEKRVSKESFIPMDEDELQTF